MPFGPLPDVVQERSPVGLQLYPRQNLQSGNFVRRQLGRAQQVQLGLTWRGLLLTVAHEAFPQGRDLALQFHLVRGRLAVHDHQVAGDATPGPQAQRLHQYAQQTQAFDHGGPDQDHRAVAGDAEPPQHALVTACGAGGMQCGYGVAGCPRQALHQRRCQVLDSGKIFAAQAHRAQADRG